MHAGGGREVLTQDTGQVAIGTTPVIHTPLILCNPTAINSESNISLHDLLPFSSILVSQLAGTCGS